MKLKITSSVLLGLFLSCVATHQHDPTDKILLTEIVKTVNDFHFQPRAIDDQLSEEIFTKYLAKLDPQKVFFTQDEIAQLQPFEHQIDDELKQANFDFFDRSIILLNQGIAKAEKLYQNIIAQSIDINTNEIWETDPIKLSYTTNDSNLEKRWQSKIKHSLLTALSVEEKLNPTLSLEEQKNNALKKVKKQYSNQFITEKGFDSTDRLQQYINTYLGLNDFQSYYLSTAQKEAWDDTMTRSFVGVGISYEVFDQYPKITNLTIGGPIWESKKIDVGDVILKIKTDQASPIDLYGLPNAEVTQLLKGEKGSSVILSIKKATDQIMEVPIIRNEIKMELATSLILTSKTSDQKIGYLKLPRFYAGAEGSAAHILAELRQLKKNKVDGIIFDVRNNKGGRSRQATEILGYFLEKGIVMQSMRRDGDHNIVEDEDGRAFYKDELIVLVNSQSSSASELLSGTLQDYDRAVIVGGNATFGKGTMQNFFNLDTEIDSVKYQLGDIKLTIGKFYSASGRSSQHRGIIPDINLPDDQSFVISGQRAHPNPFTNQELPIKPCLQTVNTNPNLDQVIVKSKERIEKNERFQLATKKAKMIQDQQENSTVNLDYLTFQKNAQKKQLQENSYQKIFNKIDDFQVNMSPEDLSSTDSAFIEKQERLIKKLGGDPYLYECFWIMKDLRG